MTGYCNCDCRDCFEVAIAGDDESAPSLCGDCEEAGCEVDSECQAEGSYGVDDEETGADSNSGMPGY